VLCGGSNICGRPLRRSILINQYFYEWERIESCRCTWISSYNIQQHVTQKPPSPQVKFFRSVVAGYEIRTDYGALKAGSQVKKIAGRVSRLDNGTV
jgi:hypothetical protein